MDARPSVSNWFALERGVQATFFNRLLVLIGMEHYATEEQRPQLAIARAAADKWLVETPLATQDDRAWRLWGLTNSAEMSPQPKRLASRSSRHSTMTEAGRRPTTDRAMPT